MTKGNECVYRPSRRGGPRIRKKTSSRSPQLVALNIRPQEADGLVLADASQQRVFLQGTSYPALLPPPLTNRILTCLLVAVDVQNYIDPGAALGQLPDMPQDSDFIFDSLFPAAFPAGVFEDVPMPQGLLAAPQKSGPLVRTYRSDRTLLQAYYCWIHPYVPIFPPPETSPPVDEPFSLSQNEPHPDEDFEPSTPVALALSAVLALIPCAEDTDSTGADSVLFRRKCAQFFAQTAIESIEAESEIPDSATEPHKALESSPPPADRPPFHPRVPVELESIIALDLLSIYEYAQRGNIKKMRTRAGQALMEAMTSFSLHTQTDDTDFFAEAKRRVWWMTVSCGYSATTSNGLSRCCFVFACLTNLCIVCLRYPELDREQHSTLNPIPDAIPPCTATSTIATDKPVAASVGTLQCLLHNKIPDARCRPRGLAGIHRVTAGHLGSNAVCH